MKKIFVALFLVLFIFGSVEAAEYGKRMVLTEVTKISAILDDPGAYLGQRVQVGGLVVEVCSMRGCWLNLAGDRPYETIKIKVTDGEIIFPISASGKQAVVEGTVVRLHMSLADMIKYKEHLAKEKGEPFDPASVTRAEKIVQIQGIAAVIKD